MTLTWSSPTEGRTQVGQTEAGEPLGWWQWPLSTQEPTPSPQPLPCTGPSGTLSCQSTSCLLSRPELNSQLPPSPIPRNLALVHPPFLPYPSPSLTCWPLETCLGCFSFASSCVPACPPTLGLLWAPPLLLLAQISLFLDRSHPVPPPS